MAGDRIVAVPVDRIVVVAECIVDASERIVDAPDRITDTLDRIADGATCPVKRVVASVERGRWGSAGRGRWPGFWKGSAW